MHVLHGWDFRPLTDGTTPHARCVPTAVSYFERVSKTRDNLIWLKTNMARIQAPITTDTEYRQAVSSFAGFGQHRTSTSARD